MAYSCSARYYVIPWYVVLLRYYCTGTVVPSPFHVISFVGVSSIFRHAMKHETISDYEFI